MKKIYIAGKLNDNSIYYVKNLHAMCKCAIEIQSLGYAVFIPGLNFLMGFLDGDYEYDDYFNNDVPFLECCDAVFLVKGWESSKGVNREIEIAKEKGIPVFHCKDAMINFFRGNE